MQYDKLYNQLLPRFFSNQSETLHSCCRPIEDVRLLFDKETIIFDKITACSNFEIFQAIAKTGFS